MDKVVEFLLDVTKTGRWKLQLNIPILLFCLCINCLSNGLHEFKLCIIIIVHYVVGFERILGCLCGPKLSCRNTSQWTKLKADSSSQSRPPCCCVSVELNLSQRSAGHRGIDRDAGTSRLINTPTWDVLIKFEPLFYILM